jgi:hypothetical protein
MDRYYIGYDQHGRGEVFGWDLEEEPTPDDTGYESIEGPFDTSEEAREACEA